MKSLHYKVAIILACVNAVLSQTCSAIEKTYPDDALKFVQFRFDEIVAIIKPQKSAPIVNPSADRVKELDQVSSLLFALKNYIKRSIE